ncbi:hypothetical protein SAMN05443287_11359 [Micromonospora phaseoli]|uniref:Uncharacterized protein n=1 Tax=Micromonospora phaseoli TaxID=1144548 RepID=A0A1H7DKM4_9ACTN|nr:hypothetical protein CLV64_11378 [Micromonospora phaseoli]GIJ78071.1 hypothetical protein Xph01_25030 [Micromonospora phaseoli]SEJ99780.1 hypothetical protein SAMN05443287_11359 [Micromonospora phaseoli]
MATVAALGALWLLIVLIAGRRQDLLGVAMALLCVLLATVAGVAVTAARQRDADGRPGPGGPSVHAAVEPPGVDADTLETLGDREAIRAMRDRHRRDDRSR